MGEAVRKQLMGDAEHYGEPVLAAGWWFPGGSSQAAGPPLLLPRHGDPCLDGLNPSHSTGMGCGPGGQSWQISEKGSEEEQGEAPLSREQHPGREEAEPGESQSRHKKMTAHSAADSKVSC